MDYDDFKRRLEARRRKNFEDMRETFNKLSREQGWNMSFEEALEKSPLLQGEVLGEGIHDPVPPPPEMPSWGDDPEKARQLYDLFLDVFRETTDEDPRDIVLRAMAVYRSFVKHARAGGQVKFVGVGAEKTLKVRLR